MRKRAPELERGVQGGWCRERKAARTDTGSMRADAKDGRAGGVPLINSLEFFINSFNFCRGKRGVFLCTATECRRGWQRKATGCQGLWRRVSGTAGSCGEPCADGPGLREAVCGRAAGASVRLVRGVRCGKGAAPEPEGVRCGKGAVPERKTGRRTTYQLT